MKANKHILLDGRAKREISAFPKQVRTKLAAYTAMLSEEGRLEKPFAKKLQADPAIYEIRIKYKGVWRVIYAYFGSVNILILSAFHKKTQKIPINEIKKAQRRLAEYV
ncbi:MAG: type II toxin-antitoxin system RelE/ParE family toxin [Candidatus Pacebacteria bacterium]|nr:type II toxin-antitoxin system RelE/ParE family toxin [Candidatus Paceibacterota bacterium]PIR60931.1 MAG: hypothetical protein COU68_02110 [Candidatus Pacebacteria bacterium CG10_big_fil_rev_8_21_14_0_10_45_6]